MVCPRCIMVVKERLQSLNLHPKAVELGYAETEETLSEAQLAAVTSELRRYGFDVLSQAEEAVVEQVKQSLVAAVSRTPADNRPLSLIVSEHTSADYPTISRTFSAAEGRTIESYFITLRIERIKELLSYGELSIKEIAYKMGFSSVAHLSRQFKQTTGVTPTEYRQTNLPQRIPLSEV